MSHHLPSSLQSHRIMTGELADVLDGNVRHAPLKSLWLLTMLLGAVWGGLHYFSWAAFSVFALLTVTVLLFGHSLGSHRKLIHDSFQCPKWLEYGLVYMGVQVGLAGPLGLLRQHELRDYAQRLPQCHPYLRHGSGMLRDAWWQLCCELQLARPPLMRIEPRVANDRFYRLLERTWMLQQLPPAVLLYALGGWGFVFWGCCARVCAGVVGHWLIGYFAHNHGGMHYRVDGAAVQGRNIRFTSLLTMGESWHNNHHAYPGSARLGLYPGEWDPGWWALKLLHRIGLVWGLRLPEHLGARAELQALDIPEFAAHRPVTEPGQWHDFPALYRAWVQGRRGSAAGALLLGPAACLPVAWFKRLHVGPFLHQSTARRLTLHMDRQVIQGLPALCVVSAAHGPVLAWLGLGLLPAAVAWEAIRTIFSAE